jgi:hypothetical protein
MLATFGVAAVLSSFAACGSAAPPLTAEQVTLQLTKQVPTSTLTNVYTADTDPNKLLGRPGGYLSKTAFTDSRVQPSLLGTNANSLGHGGSVEVFADEGAATTRRNYLQEIGKRAPLFTEYDYQNGTALLRVSHQLTPAQAAEYEAALKMVSSTGSAPATPAVEATPKPLEPSPANPGTVAVATVHDAATVLLTDGTRLRQVGISAPNAGTCQATQATAATDTEVHRGSLTYQLLGQTDVYGNQWAYLQVNSTDLGEKLAGLGWVWAYPDSPAPQAYNQRILNQVDAARAAKAGQFGAICPESAAPGTAAPGTAVPGPAVAASPASTISDGTYVVGVDIQPGTYRTAGPSEDAVIKTCIWSRRSDTSGEFKSVIATNIAQGPTTVTIKPTDGAFESRGCSPWQKIN